ncbi:hypothetical protein IW261DRAFT_1454999 [Armillaria novae-zelandiae]|uniref:Uncharacterized protein n=1 Tax=Armillaria novae-zelandiae TaxID=153914 RepID=A0AA39UGH2_9AGAR|nr:hypothetical protein IW261DRAFT_1454999 [Armillaria novae-zelandiae]
MKGSTQFFLLVLPLHRFVSTELSVQISFGPWRHHVSCSSILALYQPCALTLATKTLRLLLKSPTSHVGSFIDLIPILVWSF